MNFDQVTSVIESLNAIRRPIYITGEPGVGKTSGAKQAATNLSLQYIHLHCATMLTEDMGMPDVMHDRESFTYKMPHWWPTDPLTKALLCLDDMGQSSSDIQKVLANIMQERELHGHKLPDGVHVIGTGNRQQDRSGTNRILGHLANRYTEIEQDVDLDTWCRFAIDHGIHPSVISFVRFRPELLQDYDPQRSGNPTARSWTEGVSPILDVVSAELEYDCVKGAIGEGAAAEFVGFRKIERALPNIDNLLQHPDTTDVPSDPATLYAISGAIAHRCDTKNFDAAIKYCNRMPQEFGVLTVSYATRKDAALASTPGFTTWAVANQDVLF